MSSQEVIWTLLKELGHPSQKLHLGAREMCVVFHHLVAMAAGSNVLFSEHRRKWLHPACSDDVMVM